MNAISKQTQSLWPMVAGTLVAVLGALAQPAHAGLLGGGGGLSGGASGQIGGSLGGMGGLGQRPDLSRGRDALQNTRDRADQAAGKVNDRAQQATGRVGDGVEAARIRQDDRLSAGADLQRGPIGRKARDGRANIQPLGE